MLDCKALIDHRANIDFEFETGIVGIVLSQPSNLERLHQSHQYYPGRNDHPYKHFQGSTVLPCGVLYEVRTMYSMYTDHRENLGSSITSRVFGTYSDKPNLTEIGNTY